MTYTTWPPRVVDALDSKLTELQHTTSNSEPEISEWLTRLLVVRSCGYLEQTVAEVCRAYVDGKSGGLVRSFARTWLERTRNPTPSNLVQLVGRFDQTLCDSLVTFLDDDDQRLRRELEFLVDRRNKIAHGLSEGVGLRKALDLQSVAREIADWFILNFNPER